MHNYIDEPVGGHTYTTASLNTLTGTLRTPHAFTVMDCIVHASTLTDLPIRPYPIAIIISAPIHSLCTLWLAAMHAGRKISTPACRYYEDAGILIDHYMYAYIGPLHNAAVKSYSRSQTFSSASSAMSCSSSDDEPDTELPSSSSESCASSPACVS